MWNLEHCAIVGRILPIRRKIELIIAAKVARRVCDNFRCMVTSNESGLLRAYKMCIRPIFAVWHTCLCPTKVKNVEVWAKAQNSFTRKLLRRSGKLDYRSIPDSFERGRKLELDPLFCEEIFLLNNVHKILRGAIHLGVCRFFTTRISSIRSAAVKLSYPLAGCSLRFCYFTCRAGSEYVGLSKRASLPSFLSFQTSAWQSFVDVSSVFCFFFSRRFVLVIIWPTFSFFLFFIFSNPFLLFPCVPFW